MQYSTLCISFDLSPTRCAWGKWMPSYCSRVPVDFSLLYYSVNESRQWEASYWLPVMLSLEVFVSMFNDRFFPFEEQMFYLIKALTVIRGGALANIQPATQTHFSQYVRFPSSLQIYSSLPWKEVCGWRTSWSSYPDMELVFC